ncbi:tyrosine-protein phosphatase [Kineosporia babensis]
MPWPPATVIDLREPTRPVSEHPLAHCSTVLSAPVLGELNRDPASALTSLEALYLLFAHGAAAARLAQAVTLIAAAPAPVLVHCTAGKDRTGLTVAVALLLAGVSQAAIVADYQLTESALPAVHDRIMAALSPDAPPLPTGVAAALHGVEPQALLAFLTAVNAFPGGANAWFFHHGGSAESVHRLQQRLISGTEPR